MTIEYLKEAGWELVQKLPLEHQITVARDVGKAAEAMTAIINGGQVSPIHSPVCSWVLVILLNHFYRQTPLEFPAKMLEVVLQGKADSPYECITCGFAQPKEFTACVLCGNLTGPEGSYGERKLAGAWLN